MSFAIGHLVGAVIRPESVLVLVAVIGLLLGRRRWGRRLQRVGVIGLFLLLALPVQQWALLPLEDRFPRPPAPAHVDGVIVLGGAVETFISAARGIPSLNDQAERMTELVALRRRYPEAKLVFTGGLGTLLPGAEPEAQVATALFASLGVPAGRITYEGASRNTWENAVFSKRLVQPVPGSIWLLVTSADHMPRAVGVFRAVGWPVIAWPVAYKTTPDFLLTLLAPLPAKLAGLDEGLHEWAGLLAYWVMGRIASPFPAPGGTEGAAARRQ